MLKNFRNVYHGSPQSQWIHGQEKSGRYQAPPLLLFFQWSRNMCCCLPSYIGEDMLKSINNMLCAMESHPMRNSERRAPRTHSNLTNIKWWNIYYYLCRILWSSKPAALRGRNKDPPIYLAASHSKKHVCRVYKEASHEIFVSTSVFYDMWKNMSSNQNSHPINDVCFKCE